MVVHRIVPSLLAVLSLALVAVAIRPVVSAILLYRGKFALLEKWDDDRCFLPAVRSQRSPQGKPAFCRNELAPWASRRFRAQFPQEDVYDLALLAGDEVLLLLRRTPEAQALDYREKDTRLVVLNPSCQVVSESERFDINAYGFDLQFFSSWEGPAILVVGGGTGQCGLLFRRGPDGFYVVSCKSNKEVDPCFSCWCGLKLVDLDGDGIPEVLGAERSWRDCPICGKDGQADIVTWKFVDGSYRLWTRRGEQCGLDCELAWSIR